MKQDYANNSSRMTFNILSETEMVDFGGRLAGACKYNKCVIYLKGDLGAGKTTLSRGFMRAFGYERPVKSPTYTIVEPYEIDAIKVYHFDLYRLTNAEELTYIGALDYFAEDAIFLIEWPDKGEGVLPLPDLVCSLDRIDEFSEDGRFVKVDSCSRIGDVILQAMQGSAFRY